jgi:hypothetical protein
MTAAKFISLTVLVACLALPAVAQGGKPGGRPTLGAGNDHRRPGPHFGDWLRKNLNTPSEQKQKALEDDPKFKSLPPERQQKLKDRLQWFNSLPPNRQQQILSRMEAWEHMTPEQHQQARGLMDRMRALPDERRNALRDQFRILGPMNAEQRQRAMNNDQFRRNFNDDERDLISKWLSFRDTNKEDAAPSLDDPPEH